MEKLTDQEFREVCAALQRTAGNNPDLELSRGVRKLLANYQEQLELESYACIELQRYTDENTADTTLDVNLDIGERSLDGDTA